MILNGNEGQKDNSSIRYAQIRALIVKCFCDADPMSPSEGTACEVVRYLLQFPGPYLAVR